VPFPLSLIRLLVFPESKHQSMKIRIRARGSCASSARGLGSLLTQGLRPGLNYVAPPGLVETRSTEDRRQFTPHPENPHPSKGGLGGAPSGAVVALGSC